MAVIFVILALLGIIMCSTAMNEPGSEKTTFNDDDGFAVLQPSGWWLQRCNPGPPERPAPLATGGPCALCAGLAGPRSRAAAGSCTGCRGCPTSRSAARRCVAWTSRVVCVCVLYINTKPAGCKSLEGPPKKKKKKTSTKKRIWRKATDRLFIFIYF
jgi:hypothetical protein